MNHPNLPVAPSKIFAEKISVPRILKFPVSPLAVSNGETKYIWQNIYIWPISLKTHLHTQNTCVLPPLLTHQHTHTIFIPPLSLSPPLFISLSLLNTHTNTHTHTQTITDIHREDANKKKGGLPQAHTQTHTHCFMRHSPSPCICNLVMFNTKKKLVGQMSIFKMQYRKLQFNFWRKCFIRCGDHLFNDYYNLIRGLWGKTRELLKNACF